MYIGPNKLQEKSDNNCERKKNKDTRSAFTLNPAKQAGIKISRSFRILKVFYHIDFFKNNHCFKIQWLKFVISAFITSINLTFITRVFTTFSHILKVINTKIEKSQSFLLKKKGRHLFPYKYI
jgi:hypothetical protein